MDLFEKKFAHDTPEQSSNLGGVPTHNVIDALRERTRSLHKQAERTGIVSAMLRGTASLDAYILYLRNLAPIYREMEWGLERLRHIPGIGKLAVPSLYRSAAIDADFRTLIASSSATRPGHSLDHASDFPLLASAQRYAARAAVAASGDAIPLIAHVYVRYMGDLSGGQILKRLLAKSLGIGSAGLSFYEFPDIGDVAAFKARYLADMVEATSNPTVEMRVLEEAEAVFALNIELSVDALAAAGQASPDLNDAAIQG